MFELAAPLDGPVEPVSLLFLVSLGAGSGSSVIPIRVRVEVLQLIAPSCGQGAASDVDCDIALAAAIRCAGFGDLAEVREQKNEQRNCKPAAHR